MTAQRRRGRWFRWKATAVSHLGDRQGLAVIIGLVAVFMTIAVLATVRHVRLLRERDGWNSVATLWDASWPSLPDLSLSGLREEVARAVYAFAGRHPETLRQIPCFCGCRRLGHQSNHDCYVKRRSNEGQVVEWDTHGAMCPVGPDITGHVMLWQTKGQSMKTIRSRIEREFWPFGPATPTPPVESRK